MENLNQPKHWNLFILHSLVFLGSHFLLLFNHGVYWDDYTIIGTDLLEIKERHFAAGLPFVYYLHAFVLWLNNTAWFYHFLVFVFYYTANWYLLKLAQRIFNFETIKTIIFLFVLNTVCFNTNKILVSCFHYTVSYLAASYVLYHFYVGLTNCSVTHKIGLFLLSLITFTTASFLFYLPLVYFLLLFRRELLVTNIVSFRIVFSTFFYTVRRVERLFVLYYVAALGMYFAVKKIFPLKYPYADYNQISIQKVGLTIQKLSSSTQKKIDKMLAVINEINNFFSISLFVATLITLFSLYVIYQVIKTKKERQADRKITFAINLIIAVMILFAAVFPYILVGKSPTFLEFGNRHQLLIPFGFSLMVVFGVEIFSQYIFKRIFLGVLIFSQTFLLSSFLIKYQVAEFRDIYLVNQLRLKQKEFNKGVILFENKAPKTNEVLSMGFIRSYSLSGLYREATSKQDILLISNQQSNTLKGEAYDIANLSPMLRDGENVKDYHPTNFIVGKIIFGTKRDINTKVLLNWMWLKNFESAKKLAIDLDKYFSFVYQSNT